MKTDTNKVIYKNIRISETQEQIMIMLANEYGCNISNLIEHLIINEYKDFRKYQMMKDTQNKHF